MKGTYSFAEPQCGGFGDFGVSVIGYGRMPWRRIEGGEEEG